jgi:ubiquinone/menaquinone biosynthesis C-methylase UbiE
MGIIQCLKLKSFDWLTTKILESNRGQRRALEYIFNQEIGKQRAIDYVFNSKELAGPFGKENPNRRDIWVKEKLEALKPGSTLIDIGAGEQPYRKFCTHLNYVAQDYPVFDSLDQNGLHSDSWDYKKIDIKADVHSLPLPDDSYDAVLCTEVLEHIHSPIVALKEVCRILKPGGTLILTAPFCSLSHFSPHFYYSGFSENFYSKFLPENLVMIEEVTFNGGYFQYIAQEIYTGRVLSVIGQTDKYYRGQNIRDHDSYFD